MRKMVLLLVLMFLLPFPAFAGSNCIKTAEKIYVLQNQIVNKSFSQLKKGAWALYSTKGGEKTKAVYWGREVSPKTGKNFYMIELQGKPAGQVWYKLTPKDVRYGGKIYRFWTLEPMEIYAKLSDGIVYISKQEIELFMQVIGGRWSIILKEGTIVSPPDCSNLPEITVTTLGFPNQRRIKATVIKFPKNGGELYCSSEVPFGFIKTHSSYGVGSPYLVDFGFHGGTRRISKEMAVQAKPIQIPNMPGGIKIHGLTIQIRGAK